MLFWIVTVVIGLIVMCIMGAVMHDGEPGLAVLTFVMGALVWFVGCGLILGGIAFATSSYEYRSTTTDNLVALETRDTTEGRVAGSVFATYGYVEGERVLSYIVQDADGGYHLGYVDAENSVVYEDDSRNPVLETNHFERVNPGLVPWVLNTGETYTLYVPVGSVTQDDYTVAP